MSRIVYDDDAREEVREGMDFYDGRQPGLGLDFYLQIETVVARLVQRPKAFPQYGRTRFRKARPKRFPYTVYFAELANGVWIAAVRHDRQQKDTWLNRQPPTDPA